MKNLKHLMLIALCLAITACTDGQIRRTVTGNHDVVKKERTTDSFTGIRVSTGIDVYLKQGDMISVVLEADENLHEYIMTEVKNGILNIYTDANIRDAERKRVYVTMKEITSLRSTSAGDIFGETPVRTDNLKLSASSAGDIKLEVYADNVEAGISSSGDITLTGEAETLNANLSSAGDLNAYNFKVREADVSASSAGDADIYVTEKLIARASSAGDINYKGDPKYIDAHSSSAGGIHSR
jgi:hypothetical protein